MPAGWPSRRAAIRFELACLPQEDFPQMSAGALPHRFRLAADDLIALIEKTRFAISTEETRFYLNGIYLHAPRTASRAVLRAVATDGHRLARYELELPDGAERHSRRDHSAQDGRANCAACWTMPTAPSRSACPTPRSSSPSTASN